MRNLFLTVLAWCLPPLGHRGGGATKGGCTIELKEYAGWYFRVYVSVRLFEEVFRLLWIGGLGVHPLGWG